MGFQQPKDQPGQFSGSESECVFMLALVDLFGFKTIGALKLGVASSHEVNGSQQVVTEIATAGFIQPSARSLWIEANI